MRKNLAKLFVVLSLAILTAVISIFVVSADTDTEIYTVNYIVNGEVKNSASVASGALHQIKSTKISATQVNKEFIGWYTDEGRFFTGTSLGMKITIEKDYNLYEAYGSKVNNATDLKRLIAQNGPGNYIQLTADIKVDQTLVLPSSGTITIDLNNHKLDITSAQNAFEGTSATVHIVDSSKTHKGSITFKCTSDSNYMSNAMFNYAPSVLKKDVSIRVLPAYGTTTGKISLNSNVGFFNIANDISQSGYTFKFDLPVILNANYFVHSSGMKNAVIDVDATTEMSFWGARIFEDKGTNDGKVLSFNLDAGIYTLGEITVKTETGEVSFVKDGTTTTKKTTTIFSNEQNRYNLFLSGGRFNKDIASMFPEGNYSFTLNISTSKYDFKACAHNNEIIDVSKDLTCTTQGQITYKCKYCNLVEEKTSAPLGHSIKKELTKEAYGGSETTAPEPGQYTITCDRCNYREIEEFYPNPKDTYVRVGFRDGTEIRLPATTVYSKDIGINLYAFTPLNIEYVCGVKREDVIMVEIPMGVETIVGKDGTDGAKIGAFYQVEYIEEIILPKSIKNVQKYSFSEMPHLKTITGLENVSDIIDKEAFKQLDNSQCVVEHMVLNVKEIGENAFRNVRMTTLTFNKSVDKIKNNAFALDEAITTQLVEIFIEENTVFDYARVSEISGAFSERGSGQQFGDKNIVFKDHDYETETVAPTCKDQGYDKNYCRRCSIYTEDNFVDPCDHDYSIDVTVESTCVITQGEIYKQCSTPGCTEKLHIKWLEPNPNNHAYVNKGYYTTKYEPTKDICTQNYFILDVCGCGKVFNKSSMSANGGVHKPTGKHELDYKNPIETVKSTCTKAGHQVLFCNVCETEITIDLDIIKHDWVRGTDIPSTCTEKGERVFNCSMCGIKKEPATYLPIDPNNHAWDGNWETTLEPTTQSVGQKQQTCTKCGAKDIQHIPILAEEAEKESKTLLIVLTSVGGVIVVALLAILLYYTLFKKNPARKHKYDFDSYSTGRR